MHVPRAIPERTIDAWVSIYLAQRYPDMRLWLPTSGWDQAVDPGLANAKIALLECKTSEQHVTATHGTHQRIEIDRAQLFRYLKSPVASRALYYVLPTFPADWAGNDAQTGPIFPAESSYWPHAPTWALWAISAVRLFHQLGGPAGIPANPWIAAHDVPTVPGARRLPDFCTGLEDCSRGLPLGTVLGVDHPSTIPDFAGVPSEDEGEYINPFADDPELPLGLQDALDYKTQSSAGRYGPIGVAITP
jgi:hypothetical protein